MPLMFSKISSPGGERDVVFDLTAGLEPSELLTGQPTIEVARTELLEVSEITINDAEILDQNAETIAIGKAVVFHIKTLKAARIDVDLLLKITGDSGTVETYTLVVPVRTLGLRS